MALVDRKVDRFAEGAAAVMERCGHVGQTGEVAEVLDGRVAPSVLEITHERRSVGRGEDEVGIADRDAALGVASVLDEGRRSGGRHQLAGQALWKTDPGAVDFGTTPAVDLEGLGKAVHFDAHSLEQPCRRSVRSVPGLRC